MLQTLCDGTYESDVFIFPAAHLKDEILRSHRWVENNVSVFSGFDYVIINDELRLRSAQKALEKRGETRSVVITTGGSDPEGVLFKIIEWVCSCPLKDLNIKVLVGENFLRRKDLASVSNHLPAQIDLEPFDYKRLVESDVAISTFGSSTYELLYLGVPVLSIGHAPTNDEAGKNLSSKIDSVRHLGLYSEIGVDDFRAGFKWLLNSSSPLRKGNEFIDGNGAARISRTLEDMIVNENW